MFSHLVAQKYKRDLPVKQQTLLIGVKDALKSVNRHLTNTMMDFDL